MKAFDILCALLYSVSAAAHRLDDLDHTIRAGADTAADTAEGLTAPAGLEPDAARVLAEFLAEGRHELHALAPLLRNARAHASTLLTSLQTGNLVDTLDDGRGGEVVIEVTT